MNVNPRKKPSATERNELEDDLEDRIRLRAHDLYEARGREDGHELEHWLRAEEEIAVKKFRTASLIHTKVEQNTRNRQELRTLNRVVTVLNSHLPRAVPRDECRERLFSLF